MTLLQSKVCKTGNLFVMRFYSRVCGGRTGLIPDMGQAEAKRANRELEISLQLYPLEGRKHYLVVGAFNCCNTSTSALFGHVETFVPEILLL